MLLKGRHAVVGTGAVEQLPQRSLRGSLVPSRGRGRGPGEKSGGHDGAEAEAKRSGDDPAGPPLGGEVRHPESSVVGIEQGGSAPTETLRSPGIEVSSRLVRVRGMTLGCMGT